MPNLLFTPAPAPPNPARRAALVRDLSLIWGQWRAVGMRGRIVPEAVHVIDPEPLLLASLVMARYDPLLLDALLAWLERHGALVNLQRLQGLRRAADPVTSAALGAVAAIVGGGGDPLRKWRALAGAPVNVPATPYFLDVSGRPRLVGRAADPDFLRHGLQLAGLVRRLRAGGLGTGDAASLLLRLRALCGLSMRCEILCVLGTGGRHRAAGIARQIAQSPRATQKVLVEMAGSGCVSQVRGHRRRDYEIVAGSPLLPLLRPVGAPTPWVDAVAACRLLASRWVVAGDGTQAGHDGSGCVRSAGTGSEAVC